MSQEVDILTVSLPKQPGTDLASKLLSKENEIMNIIVKIVTNDCINGSMYHVSSNEFSDGRKSDVIYVPQASKVTDTIPPILIEFQQVVNFAFMKRIMRYCLSIHDTYKLLPKVVVFSIKGFFSKAFMNDNFYKIENCSFLTTSTKFWAESFNFYTLDSIAPFVKDDSTMEPIVALTYFLCRQEKSIMSLDESEDKELRKIYEIAFRSFSNYVTTEESSKDLANDTLEKTNKQFEKILECARINTDESLKKIILYAKNGVEFTEKRRKLYIKQDETITVTPIEDTDSADLHFVKRYSEKLNGRMNWRDCYTLGKDEKLFDQFGSHLSLKDAFLNGRL